MFEEPDTTGGLRVFPKDVLGHNLLVWAVDYIAHSPTRLSRPDRPSDVIVVDLVDLDTVFQGECLVARKCWWRAARLIQALRGKIGRVNPLLVRMATEASGTPGMNDAYVLVSVTSDNEVAARAEKWMREHPDFQPSESFPNAAPSQQQQQPNPYGQQPYAPQPQVQPQPPRQPSLLERMAAQQAASLRRIDERSQPLPPPAPNQFDEPPF